MWMMMVLAAYWAAIVAVLGGIERCCNRTVSEMLGQQNKNA